MPAYDFSKKRRLKIFQTTFEWVDSQLKHKTSIAFALPTRIQAIEIHLISKYSHTSEYVFSPRLALI